MRPHLSLDVRNVPESVEFYQKIFKIEPQKQTSDYAKFDLSSPALGIFPPGVFDRTGERGEPLGH